MSDAALVRDGDALVTLPYPMEHQRDVLMSNARFKVWNAGRRTGKTVAGLIACVEGHGPRLKDGTRKFRGALDGARVAWVAPTNPQARRVIWPQLCRALRGAWSKKSEVDRVITLPTGGEVWVLSADAPISALGTEFDGIVPDEFARIRPRVWQETLRPTISSTDGWAMFMSTPAGMGNLHHRYYQRGQDGEDGWASWTTPTSANPMISRDELESAREEVGTLIFAQEYEAQFVSDGIAVFKSDHVQTYDALPPSLDSTVITVDAAFKDEDTSDYVVIQAWGISGPHRYLLSQRRDRLDAPKTCEAILEMRARHTTMGEAPPVYVEEAANGYAVMQMLRDRVAGVVPVYRRGDRRRTDSKIARARSVQHLWESGHVLLPNPRQHPWADGLIDRITAFPNSDYDDEVDAMVYALQKLQEGSRRNTRKPIERGPASRIQRVVRQGW